MQRWLFFVRLDERHDLRTVGSRKGWRRLPDAVSERRMKGLVAIFGSWLSGMLDPPWTPDGADRGQHARVIMDGLKIAPTVEESEEWFRAVFALRSLSRRAIGHKRPKSLPRKRAIELIDPCEADAVFRHYFNMLTPDVRPSGKKSGLRSLDRVVLTPALPKRVRCFGDGARVFWQMVFSSMCPGSGVPVCSDCGVPLPDTRTGRHSKGQRCPRCRYKKWESALSDEERRKRNRERQRRRRDAEKKPNQRKSK